jgi:hypothetical protein
VKVGGRALGASADRIVALLQFDNRADTAHLEWVELDFSGHVIERPGQHSNFLPWALTPGGVIYARENGGNLVFFDRAAGTWKPAAITPPGSLFWADETSLVFRLPNSTTFEWFPVNQ